MRTGGEINEDNLLEQGIWKRLGFKTFEVGKCPFGEFQTVSVVYKGEKMNLFLEQTLPLFKEGPGHRAILVLLVGQFLSKCVPFKNVNWRVSR